MSLDISKLENVKHQAGKIICRCPACAYLENSDSKSVHLTIYQSGAYNCAKYNKESDHNRLIYQLAGLDSKGTVPPLEVKVDDTPKQDKIFDKEILKTFLPDYRYFNGRGIPNDVLKRFEGGLGCSGALNKYFSFPIYNNKGQIHGLSGRYVLDEKKYNKPKIKHLGRKSNFVWPIHINEKAILDKREIILVESIPCILSLATASINTGLCLFGINLSNRLLNTIIALNPNKIVIATNLDNEHNVGQKAALDIRAKLVKFFDESKVIISLPTKKDFNDMLQDGGVESIKEWYGKIN